MGQAYQSGECANGARLALLQAGFPEHVTGVTLDRRCCSSLDAVWIAAMKIQTCNADICLAGGMESMSQAELYIPGDIKWGLGGKRDEKWGFMPKGHGAMDMWGIPLYDRLQRARVMSQPIDRYGELNSMMAWAETAASEEGVTREEADAWAVRSHANAIAAIDGGLFKDEIVPIEVKVKKATVSFDTDEPPRRGTTIADLAKLPTVYKDGVCTAGNSSTENDGAGVVMLMSVEKAKELDLEPLAVFRACAVAGCDPTKTYPAVPASVFKALDKVPGVGIEDMGLIEIQEAFAVQALADARLMGLSEADIQAKVNVNGSGISLGHPIAATGTMRLVSLLHEMKRRDTQWGLETICGGGGQGITAVFERPRA
jgi:acetyl-CoA C-acetyltransferase